MYFWSFTLRLLVTWFDSQAAVSWRAMEEGMVHPWSLTDVLFSNISVRKCQPRFGPTVSQLFQIWHSVEKYCNSSCRWHLQSPIFNNKDLLIGGRPITFSHWDRGGIHFLGDIFDLHGLHSFQDIKHEFNWPGTVFFFYLLLRAALKAHGVPRQHIAYTSASQAVHD